MYGVAAAAGVILSTVYLKLSLRRFHDLTRDSELMAVFAALGAFIGAKLLYLLVVLPEFVSETGCLLSDTGAFLEKYVFSGFVFYGGLYGALFALWIYSKKYCLSYSRVLAFILPVFPLIHVFGRIGCFCMGCCYGVRTGGALSVTFKYSAIAPNGVPLVPVQLIEAGAELALFAVTAALRHRTGGYRMLAIYLGAYSAFRFIIEFWRGDASRGFIGVLSVSQTISLITLAALPFAAGALAKKRRTGEKR